MAAAPADLNATECPIQWHTLPADAQAWAEAHGYGEDDAELLYVLTDEEAPEGYPALTVTI
ncbi:hypothetical protein JJV70_02105 [Streptomyces sp. JJ66]|uniref:hypothetical protein n=1 Tax=Streptomyces sp. JJ66 TaxID=2803843 RepID=UPI001C566635|nr:hypothetical protein [Streptomyces sp. JJ66]MBW1600914.1 hypothetical protein [Streptomyces sp. JJ66]